MSTQQENIFDDIVQSMITQMPNGEVQVANYVNVQGQAGRVHQLTTQQLFNFGSILSGTHPTQLGTTPLAFLAFQFKLQDLIDLNARDRIVPTYKLYYSKDGEFVKLSGWSVPRADAVAGTAAGKEEHFEHTLRGVGRFAGVALLQVIVNQDERLLAARMQYDNDFEFIFENGAIRFRAQE